MRRYKYFKLCLYLVLQHSYLHSTSPLKGEYCSLLSLFSNSLTNILQYKCTVVSAPRRGGNEIKQLTVQQVEGSAETADQGPCI